MLCLSCGRDSRNPQYCEWCRKPMTANVSPPPNTPQQQYYPPQQPLMPGQMPPHAPQYPQYPQQPMAGQTPPQPASQPVRRVSLTGEVYEEMSAPPPAAPMHPQQPGNYAPPLPAGAYSPQSFLHDNTADLPSWGERFEKFLAMGLPALILCVLIVRYVPTSFNWTILLASLLVTMALSGAGVIPGLGEEGRECMLLIVVSFLLGPLIALAVYGILCLLRQEGSGGVAAILGIPVLVMQLLGQTFRNSADVGAMIVVFSLFGIFPFLAVCAAFVGWLVGSMFRPIGE